MRATARLLPLTSVFMLACPSTPAGDDEASDDSSSDAESETSPDTDTDTGDVCEPPPNATPTDTAMISIRNDRAVPVYVMPYSSFFCNYGKVEIELGGAPVLWQHASTYAYDCSGPLCDYGCSDGGDMGLIINPGATAEIEWGGGVWLPTPISDACREQAGCINDPGATCSVLDIVEGEYLVRVNLSATCPVEDECMACTEGVCEVFFYEPYAADIVESFTATATFPAGAEIVIE